MVKYVFVIVMCDSDLERMFEVLSKYFFINILELFLDVKLIVFVVFFFVDFLWLMVKFSGFFKRQKRIQSVKKDESKNYLYVDGFDEDVLVCEIKCVVSVYFMFLVLELYKWWKDKYGFGFDGFD